MTDEGLQISNHVARRCLLNWVSMYANHTHVCNRVYFHNTKYHRCHCGQLLELEPEDLKREIE